MGAVVLVSCTDEDDNGNIIGIETETNSYFLRSSSDGTSIGEVILENNGDNTITINILVEEPNFEEALQVHLHAATAAEGGPELLTLNNVDPETGISSTTFSSWNDGTEAVYEQLMIIDGYIDVHFPEEGGIYAFSDIGFNELTGTSQVYNFIPLNNSEVEGTITLEKRLDNTTLVTVNLTNPSPSAQYAAFIYEDNALDGVNSLFQFGNFNESVSYTQLESFSEGTEITFDELLIIDGHIKLFETINGVTTEIANADIGNNLLTENSEEYTVIAQNDSGIDGSILVQERINGEAILTITLYGFDSETTYSVVLFTGEMESTEEASTVISLNPIDGANGVSMTNLSSTEDLEMGFDTFTGFDGHVRIISTEDNLIVASGNIGLNAE